MFLAYGGIYCFGWGVVLAAALYVLDHLFFALAFALKTYFQKIADPARHRADRGGGLHHQPYRGGVPAGGAGLSLGRSPGAVFGLAAGMALVSLVLALLIPRHPENRVTKPCSPGLAVPTARAQSSASGPPAPYLGLSRQGDARMFGSERKKTEMVRPTAGPCRDATRRSPRRRPHFVYGRPLNVDVPDGHGRGDVRHGLFLGRRADVLASCPGSS